MATQQKTVKVQLVRSPIGTKVDHRATVRGLGLRKLNSESTPTDVPTITDEGITVKVVPQADGTSFVRIRGATSGKLLWEFPTSSGVLGQPSSFAVDGTQYVAVMSGWGVDSRGMQSRLNDILPGEFPEVPEGGTIWLIASRTPLPPVSGGGTTIAQSVGPGHQPHSTPEW